MNLLALRAHCQRRCALRGLPALTVAAMEPRPSRQAMLALHRYILKSCLGSLVVTEFVINATRPDGTTVHAAASVGHYRAAQAARRTQHETHHTRPIVLQTSEPGPHWVRTTSKTDGLRWAEAVTSGLEEPQVSRALRHCLGPSTYPDMGSNPTDPCRGAGGPCQRGRPAGVEPHPAVGLVPTLPGPTSVVLAGRATTVPFTAVLAGPHRTITDNATAASTCAVSCRRR
jgi:hypothetical protein